MKVLSTWIVLALVALGVAAAQTADMYEKAPYTNSIGKNIVTRYVEYMDGREILRGYMAYKNGTMEMPGVLIWPDADGIGGYEMWRAKQLATIGYVAFVADPFGKNVTQGFNTTSTVRQELQRNMTSTNVAMFRRRLALAFDVLRDAEIVDDDRLAGIGYCFGGSAMIETVRMWPNGTEGIVGVMAFHPGVGATTMPARAGCPIRLSLQNGYADTGSNFTQLETLQQEMTRANVTFESVRYGKAVHAFTVPERMGTFASANARYDEIADARSWSALRSFLRDVFEMTNPMNFYTDGADGMVAAAST